MKDWWKSKMLWTSLIAVANVIIRAELGLTLTPEAEVIILGVIVALLRLITKEEIKLKK
jgi:uncharacterized membrane-anchored protein